MSERGTLLCWVLLLVEVLQQGPTAAAPYHNYGPPGALRLRHRPDRAMPAQLIPARPGTDIFVLTGNIGGRGLGKGSAG